MLLYPVLTLKCTVGLVFIVNGALQVFMYVCMYVCMYNITNLIAHGSVLHRSNIRYKRTLSVVRNPQVEFNLIHWDTQLRVGFNQLMYQVTTFYDKFIHSHTFTMNYESINQSINQFICKKKLPVRQEPIELAAHGHIRNIKPQLYEQIKANERIMTKT